MSGTTNPIRYIIDTNNTITATFAPDTHTVSIATIGRGSVIKRPDSLWYDYHTLVRVEAVPDPGWHFTEWSGGMTGTANPTEVYADSDIAITAHFAINTFTLTVTAANGTVTRSPDQAQYDSNTTVQFYVPSLKGEAPPEYI